MTVKTSFAGFWRLLQTVGGRLDPRKMPPFALAAVGAALIGLSPIFVRYSVVGPVATGFYRFFMAMPFLVIWMIVDDLKGGTQFYKKRKTDYFLLLLSGVWLGLDIAFWHWSIGKTSIVNATLFNNFTVVFVAIFSVFVLKEKIAWTNLLGITMTLLGAGVLVGGDLSKSGGTWSGDLLALLSAVFFAGYVLCVKRLRSFFSAPTVMTWSCISTIYTLFLVMFFTDEILWPTSFRAWAPLIGLSLMVHVLGQGLMAYTMGHLSAALSSLIMLGSPIISTMLAWFLFDESLTPLKMAGGVIVLLGIVIARKTENKSKTEPSGP